MKSLETMEMQKEREKEWEKICVKPDQCNQLMSHQELGEVTVGLKAGHENLLRTC